MGKERQIMVSRNKDITGIKFGSLTAIKLAYVKNRRAYWEYSCVCGKTHVACASAVTYEVTRRNDPELPSCGCVDVARKTKHGFRKANDTHPAYLAYRGMMARCYNPNDEAYKRYGALGVTVADCWKDNPEAFVKWSIENGWDKGLHIDKDIKCKAKGIYPRIYSPDTCTWTTAQINVAESANRTNYGKHPNIKLSQEEVDEILHLYFSGEVPNQAELASMYGVSPSAISRLIQLELNQRNELI